MLSIFLIGICLLLTQHHVAVIADTQPSAQSAEQKAIGTSIKSFGESLVQAIAAKQPHSNIIVSPINVYASLSLALMGSASETKDELVKALNLGFAENGDVVHKLISGVLKEAGNSKHANISIANAVFVNDNLKLSEQYLQNVKTYYGSHVESLAFGAGDNKATDAVNRWVSEQTHGGIPKLYEDKIDPTTVALLASALYFEAEWEIQFPTGLTEKGTFYGVNSEQQAYFMGNKKVVQYLHSEKFTAISLPYKEGEASFYIVLPSKSETLSDLIKTVKFDDIIGKTSGKYVYYTIPKLKLKYSNELVDVMRQLGIQKAFDQSKADFSNLGVGSYIDHIVHKTELEVNEYGTIASAATITGMFLLTVPVPFKVDRPFMFFIHHQKSDAILFSGAIYNVQ